MPAMIWDQAWIWKVSSGLKAPLGLKKHFLNHIGGSNVNVKPQRAQGKTDRTQRRQQQFC
jgi:hypothetical protein